MPLLRGHHLICLHFFNGEGYDEAFINNLKKILERAEDEEITISSGDDDICRCCPYLKERRCQYTESSAEEIRDMDTEALMLLRSSRGDNVKWDEIRNTIYRIFPSWHTSYCLKCDWKDACEKNALFQELTKK
ncbi:MAG: DUF1284 domain-containing protein [Thermodesulfovibrionia bacterium]|nr:DUF1284 domain-containing protein [Thermodesulfovibrionia bacterium]